MCAQLAQSVDKVYPAINKALDGKDAGKLRSGLLAFGPLDLPANGQQPAKPHETVCFAVASCQYPARMLDQEPAFASYARLGALLELAPHPRILAADGRPDLRRRYRRAVRPHQPR